MSDMEQPSSPSRSRASSMSQDSSISQNIQDNIIMSFAFSQHHPNDFGWEFAKSHSTHRRRQTPTSSLPVDISPASRQQPNSLSTHGRSYLLSLPKELRLEIWKYVLTDPSVPHLDAQITRQPRSPTKSSLRFPEPCIHVSLKPSRNAPINLNLLRVNYFIYQESLPILYRSVRFAPLDLEGIFPLFLDTLPPYNRSLIYHAKLRIPDSIYHTPLFTDPSTSLFHWAITCAQVAKVENLRDVVIEGFKDHESKTISRGLLNPLAKMKARKIFRGENSEQAYRKLAEAEARLAAQIIARNQLQRAEQHPIHQEPKSDSLDTDSSKPQNNNPSITPPLRIDTSSSPSSPTNNPTSSPPSPKPTTPIYEDDPPPYAAGPEWYLASIHSAASSLPSSPRSPLSPKLEPTSPLSLSLSDDSWIDTAATFVGEEEEEVDVEEGDSVVVSKAAAGRSRSYSCLLALRGRLDRRAL